MRATSLSAIKNVYRDMRSVFRLSEEEEREYREKTFKESVLTLRVALVMGFFIYGLFMLQDVLSFPEKGTEILITKLFVLGGFILANALTFIKRYASFHNWNLFFLLVALVLVQFVSMYLTRDIISGYQSLYHGLPQAVICACELAQLNLRAGWLLSIICIIGNYVITSDIFSWQGEIFGGHFNNIAPSTFILSIAIIMTIYNFMVRYYRRKNFLSEKIIEEEKRATEELLLNILPKETAEELWTNGSSSAREFAHVNVLFSDFQNFTQISGQFSPSELVEELNVCFREFDHIVERYGVEKIKTIGDAYMCVSGMPDPDKSNTNDIIKVALEMMAFMQKRKEIQEAKNLIGFDMRIGINNGPVIAGIVGFKKFQFDIWGDTVNMASRMETHEEIGKIKISEATKLSLDDTDQFDIQIRGGIAVKGKGDVEMYFIRKRDS